MYPKKIQHEFIALKCFSKSYTLYNQSVLHTLTFQKDIVMLLFLWNAVVPEERGSGGQGDDHQQTAGAAMLGHVMLTAEVIPCFF